MQKAKVLSQVSARSENIGRTPPGRYLGYIPEGIRYDQAVPADPPSPPNNGTPTTSSPYDANCDPDDVLLLALGESSSSSSSECPSLLELSTPPSRTATLSTRDVNSFPDSPAPPVPASIEASTSYLSPRKTSYLSASELQRDEMMSTIHATIIHLRKLQTCLNGFPTACPRHESGFLTQTKDDVIGRITLFRNMLDNMFNSLQAID